MRHCFAFLLAAGLGLTPALAQNAPDTSFRKHIIVADHPLAVEAGLTILREGGSAADAVVAAQMVLALVEPQSSGLGGGALALSFNSATKEVLGWDGRETAPAAAGPDLFLGRDGKPMPYQDAAIGGRAVGVPGAVRMLEALHRAQGKLPWERLFGPAIQLAESGFSVSARLSAAIAADGDRLRRQPAARAYFFLPNGAPLPPGHILINRPLAETLRAIATGGADALMRGAVASDIATAVRNDPSPGLITTDDLAAISGRPRPAVCGPYRGLMVCGMGPPSSGGVGVLQVLSVLGHFNLLALDPKGIDAAHLLIEAEKLADADRAAYLADSDFVPVPIRGLLDPAYLSSRAQLVDFDRANAAPSAGNPDFRDPGLAPALPQPEHGTSQLAVVDDFGNAVSMTTTLQDNFGSRLMVRGFLLNDALTDFASVPTLSGRKVANRVEGGKRPRTSMSPTIVFTPDGDLRIVTGSEGGGRIMFYVAQTLMDMIDFGMTPRQAMAAPHVQAAGVTAELEAGTPAAELADALKARGHSVSVVPLDSGQVAVALTSEGMTGAADPRREGVVGGD
jgi:gamma-glutamyltranspeptidase/glutathione hydrolase